MTSTGSGPERLRRRAVLGIAGALTLAACTGEDAMRHERPEPMDDARKLNVDGVAVNFVRRGAGPPVVLIHGASGNLRDWTLGVLPAVAERHDVIAIDRPGHGASGWPGPEAVRLSEQARLLRRALALLGVERAIVVGHSYGGSVALAWALDAPDSVAGLLLIAAPSQVWPGGLGLSTELMASTLTGPLLAQIVPALLPRQVAEAAAARVFAPQLPPEGYLEHVDLDLLLRPTALRANALQLAALKDEVRAMVPRYPGLSTPVELVHGTADTTVPIDIHSEPLAGQIPQARLTRLAGIGHMPHHVALPEVLRALARLAARDAD